MGRVSSHTSFTILHIYIYMKFTFTFNGVFTLEQRVTYPCDIVHMQVVP